MFDYGQKLYEDGWEDSEEQTARYLDGLCEQFAQSPEAAAIADSGQLRGYAWNLLDLYFGYIGKHPAEMTLRDFNEVVFSLIPRKVSTEPESAASIIAELRAFLAFLHREHAHPQAEAILRTISGDDAIERLQAELADDRNFGMAKSMVMLGRKLGFDMMSPEGMTAFQQHFNANIAGKFSAAIEPRARPSLPPLPHLFARSFDSEPFTTSTRTDRKAKKAKRQAKKRNRRR